MTRPGRSIFYRYLRELDEAVVVTLVGPRRSFKDAFLDVSRLFAEERGSGRYRLISVPHSSIHDRWLQVDEELYQLGGSTPHAAMKTDFTVSPVDATPENLATVTGKIESGTLQFGPKQTSHPDLASGLV